MKIKGKQEILNKINLLSELQGVDSEQDTQLEQLQEVQDKHLAVLQLVQDVLLIILSTSSNRNPLQVLSETTPDSETKQSLNLLKKNTRARSVKPKAQRQKAALPIDI